MQLGDGMDIMSLDGVSPGVPLRGLDDSARRTISYLIIWDITNRQDWAACESVQHIQAPFRAR